MNAFIPYKTAGLVLLGVFLLSACATAPTVNPKVTALQTKLETLESNMELASRGGEELKTARTAVQWAVKPPKRSTDQEIAYRLYVADRLLQTAEWSARERFAEDRSKNLVKEHEKLVLQARTLEADRARAQAAQARQSTADALVLRERALQEATEAQELRDEAQLAQSVAMENQRAAETATSVARTDTENARLAAAGEAEKARMARAETAAARTDTENARLAAAGEAEKARKARAETAAAKAEMESLRGQLSELEAKQTERGLLITLGDVLFEFNKSELRTGGQRNLLPLAEALKARTDQLVIIEGHTDSIGNHAYNMTLSESRAEAVEHYLVEQGVAFNRISIKGLGPDFPVADNGSNEGRQLNRRVEVILPNLN
ncbi:MAG: OmpA family protein [Xanthomonadales bacterium]|nr:OmpA family protein [Xanthomonadales bacterium]